MKKIVRTTRTRRVATIERVVIHASLFAFCDRCKSEQPFVSIEAASLGFGFSVRETLLMVTQNTVHTAEDSNGLLFVCVQSLMNRHTAVEEVPIALRSGESPTT